MRSSRHRCPTVSARKLDLWSKESLQHAYLQMINDYKSESLTAGTKLPSITVIATWEKEILIAEFLEFQNNYEAALPQRKSWPSTQSKRKRQSTRQAHCKDRMGCASTDSHNAGLPASPTRTEPIHLRQSLAESQSTVRDLQRKLAECNLATLADRTTIEHLRSTEVSLQKDLDLSTESIHEKDNTIAQLKMLITRDHHLHDVAGLPHVSACAPGSSIACSGSTCTIAQDPVSCVTSRVEEPHYIPMAGCIRNDDVPTFGLCQTFDDHVWPWWGCSGPEPLDCDFQEVEMMLGEAEAEKCIGADEYLLLDYTVDSERFAVYV